MSVKFCEITRLYVSEIKIILLVESFMYEVIALIIWRRERIYKPPTYSTPPPPPLRLFPFKNFHSCFEMWPNWILWKLNFNVHIKFFPPFYKFEINGSEDPLRWPLNTKIRAKVGTNFADKRRPIGGFRLLADGVITGSYHTIKPTTLERSAQFWDFHTRPVQKDIDLSFWNVYW
jgi:hypothetical protein